jgi:hypothetical protein
MRLRTMLLLVAVAAGALQAGRWWERRSQRGPRTHAVLVEWPPFGGRVLRGPMPYLEAEQLARRHADHGARAAVIEMDP